MLNIIVLRFILLGFFISSYCTDIGFIVLVLFKLNERVSDFLFSCLWLLFCAFLFALEQHLYYCTDYNRVLNSNFTSLLNYSGKTRFSRRICSTHLFLFNCEIHFFLLLSFLFLLLLFLCYYRVPFDRTILFKKTCALLLFIAFFSYFYYYYWWWCWCVYIHIFRRKRSVYVWKDPWSQWRE